MKKIVFLLSLILLLTGCTIEAFEEDFDTIIDKALTESKGLSNVSFVGYEFYLPRGAKITDQKEYNAKISYNEDYYYLYVDVISYYHKTYQIYEENKNSYYSKDLQYDDKFGYIEINKVEDKYFIEMMYNYAKIEAYVEEKNIEEAIVSSCYILSTISFKDEILETLIGENILDYKEEQFDIFASKREDGNFLDYVKEFDTYVPKEDTKTKDEDFVQTTEE